MTLLEHSGCAESYRPRHYALHLPPRTLLFIFAFGIRLSAQSNSVSASQVNQLPLSGSGNANGSVTTTQSITNTGGGNSVNIVNSTVNLTGPYSGSVPDTSNIGVVSPLTLDYALILGLRNNLGPISQNNVVLQARGRRLIARSALLPNVSSSIGETLSKIDLAAQGLKSSALGISGLPAVIGPFNFFDARAVQLSQTLFDLVQLRNLHSATIRVQISDLRNFRR